MNCNKARVVKGVEHLIVLLSYVGLRYDVDVTFLNEFSNMPKLPANY